MIICFFDTMSLAEYFKTSAKVLLELIQDIFSRLLHEYNI